MTEPEKVIAPMNVPMKSSILCPRVIGTSRLIAAGLFTAAMAINTAARPTSECIAAISCGIWVICTQRATTAPIAPPIAIAARIGNTFLLCE